MAAIPYVGALETGPNDLVNYAYVEGLLAAIPSQGTVDAQINSGLSGFVTKVYVDTQDGKNATQNFIDTGDSARLHTAAVNTNGSAIGLDLTGRIPVSQVTVASTQRTPKPFYSPTGYNSSAVTLTGSEVQIYPAVSVPDPGWAYKLLVTGLLDAASNTDGEYAVIKVRQGSTTGPVVAGGYGLGESYIGGVATAYSGAGSYTYTIPTWAGALDVIALGSGGGGQDGFVFAFVSENGNPGNHGVFATSTLTRGTTLPGGTTTLSVTVGAGGIRATNGNASTVTGAGVTTVSGAGGTHGASGSNGNAGNEVYNGNTYVGGAAVAVGIVGIAPGGGGGGGTPPGSGHGMAGGDGGVWIFAYPSPSIPSGPVNIIPTALNGQSSITGATSLYVMGVRSGTASTQTVSIIDPGLFVVPLPA